MPMNPIPRTCIYMESKFNEDGVPIIEIREQDWFELAESCIVVEHWTMEEM